MLLNGLHLGSASLSIEYDGSMLIKTAKDKKLYAESVTMGAAPVPMLAKWQAMTAGAAAVASKVPELVNIGYDIQDIIDKNKE
jgi:hypothetical protein